MNLKKIALLGAIGSSALLLSACNLNKSGGSNTSSGGGQSQSQQQSSSQASDAITIMETDDGFSPATATIKSGGKITWTNNSKVKVQIASDPHPTHTANTELTGGQFVTELAPGASATVTVTKVGTWGYHDHLNPSARGKVTVQ